MRNQKADEISCQDLKKIEINGVLNQEKKVKKIKESTKQSKKQEL